MAMCLTSPAWGGVYVFDSLGEDLAMPNEAGGAVALSANTSDTAGAGSTASLQVDTDDSADYSQFFFTYYGDPQDLTAVIPLGGRR